MKERLHIRVYEIDGSLETFNQDDPDLVNRTLASLYPAQLFSQDQITIADDCFQKTFAPPRIARIDFETDCLSVWDFPFSLGALAELTEAEFAHEVEILQKEPQMPPSSQTTAYLDLQMLDERHSFLSMQVVAGLPSTRLSKIYTLLKERRLIFGLLTAGVGILNLANLVRFSVHPKPLDAASTDFTRQGNTEQKQRRRGVGSDTLAAALQIKQV